MLERELKLHVPAAKRTAMENSLRQRGATEITLHACYFDTPGRDLAKAGIALRLRREGDQWVQTIKAPGPDELSRVELNHPRPGPELDVSVYEGSLVEPALKGLEDPLQLRYETEVTRLVLKHDTGNTVLELAFDRGMVKAGKCRMALCELELELVSGAASGLFESGRDYLKEYRLILDLRSKAERGDALAQLAATTTDQNTGARDSSPGALARHASLRKPRRAGNLVLDPQMSLQQAYQACVSDCLNQIIRNAAFLAGLDGQRAGEDVRVQYVHQIRVGIRRLRSCWKFFGKWINIGGTDLAELRTHFSVLGQARDNDVVRLAIAPRLAQAGMPAMDLPVQDKALAAQDKETAKLVASPDFQICLLTLLEHQVAAQPDADTEATGRHPPLPRAAAKRLNKWLKQVCRDGEHFDHLSPEAQHSLRKKVKRLRYSLDFCSTVLAAKRAAKVRAALTMAQEKLGELNDLHSAQIHYQRFVSTQPPALFALGWLEAMRGQKIAEAQAALLALGKAGLLKHR